MLLKLNLISLQEFSVHAVQYTEHSNPLLLQSDQCRFALVSPAVDIVSSLPLKLFRDHVVVVLVTRKRQLLNLNSNMYITIHKREEINCKLLNIDLLKTNLTVAVENITNVLDTNHNRITVHSEHFELHF